MTRGHVSCVAFVLAVHLLGLPARAAEPPKPYPAPVTHRPEVHQEAQQAHDPYVPADPALRAAVTQRTIVTLGPYTSIQVNVNAMGGNIPGDAANEPSLAIDPTNANRIVIGWRQFDTIASNFRQAGRAFSTNAGATWTFPGVFTPGTFRSDPVLEADSAGRIYYNSLQGNFLCDMFISTDGGMNWTAPIPAFGGDKLWMTVDRTGGMGDGHVYLAWSVNAGCCGNNIFTRSVDGGLTYLTPIALPQNPIFGTLDVGPDGELYVCGMRQSDGAFIVARSNNAQNSAVTPTFIQAVPVDLNGFQAFGGVNPAGLLGQAWVAVNPAPGPFRGHVYLLCSVDPPGSDPLDVYFARSVDGGLNWSAPRRINDDPPGTNAWQWFGTMSVSPDGRIDVIWNDTRNDPLSATSELFYSFSCDDGATWTSNIPVSPAFNQSLGYPQQNKLGDYYDMISDNAGASVAYAATFNGEEDVYFLRIPFNADCNTNGTPDTVDLSGGGSLNCQPDCLPDECQLENNDCNTNTTPDGCDIASAASRDCQPDGVPDECQAAAADCNTNTTPDDCDIDAGPSQDCQGDGTPDECQLAGNDCNTDGLPDECEADCNTDGTPDPCQPTSGDCNSNGTDDLCEVLTSDGTVQQDQCVDAQLACPGVLYTGNTGGATVDGGSACAQDAAPDVWYRYIPGADGVLTVSLCGSSYDTALSVYDACPVAGGVELTCNDDSCGQQSELAFAVMAGTGYLIRVSGWSANSTGAYSMTLTGPDCPPSGDCDTNGTLDVCQLVGDDCNTNNTPDVCDNLLTFVNENPSPSAAGLLANQTGGLDSFFRAAAGDGPQAAEDFTTPVRATVSGGSFEAIECLDPGMSYNGLVTVSLYADAGGRPAGKPLSERAVTAGKSRVASFTPNPGVYDIFRYTLTQRPDLVIPSAGVWWISMRPQTADPGGFSRLARCQTSAQLIGAQGHWRPGKGVSWFRDVDEPVLSPSGFPQAAGYAISVSLDRDCNTNGVPDECEIQQVPSRDSNGDGVLDACQDCNTNGVTDPLEGLQDCNSNQQPDVCDVGLGLAADCNTNLRPDSCEADCNTDGVADACQTAGADCNTNATLDRCEADCNTNGSPDVCDHLRDCNTNGTFDPCDLNPIGVVRVNELSINGGAPGFAVSDDETLGTNGQPFPSPNDFEQVFADDFTLTAGAQFTGLTIHGQFDPISVGANECVDALSPGDPGAANDEFTVKWLTNNGLNNTPGTLIRTDVVSAAAGRVTRFENRFFLRFATPVALTGSGRRWVEIYYSGPSGLAFSGGNFRIGFSRNDLSLSRPRYSDVPESPWLDSFGNTQIVMGLLGGGSVLDANTNGTPDECDALGPTCTTVPGDMDGLGSVNADDVQCFVDCFIGGATAHCPFGDQCECADMDGDNDVDACDLCRFVRATLGLSPSACSPAPCP
jgi:hypothetical protein